MVKPNKANPKTLDRKRTHPSFESASHRVDFNKHARGRIADFNSTNRNHVFDAKVRAANNTTSQASATQTETRGTQTDRTGPCKCARQLQQRNQRKRSENKTNKQIVDTLERVNIIKFTN